MEDDEKRFRITPVQQMMSSCTGALITSVVVTPLDVVKIRLQVQQHKSKSFIYCNGLMDHVCCCTNEKQNAWAKRSVSSGHFTSFVDAFRKIIKCEGFGSLWSGLPPTLVMAVPATIAYFVTYEELRVALTDKYLKSTGKNEYPIYLPLIAASIARFWAVAVVNPLELIRTKMQSKNLSYQELKGACKDLYDAKGIRGFWLGFWANVIRDVPFSAIYWGTYEAQKKLYGVQNEVPSATFSFFAGALAGSVAGAVTLPVDVVKTHKQIELGEIDFQVKGKRLSSSKEIALRIYKQNGVNGLFSGLVPRLVKVAPACAIMISTYEYAKNFFTRYNKKKYELIMN